MRHNGRGNGCWMSRAHKHPPIAPTKHTAVQARGTSLPDCEGKQLVKLTKTCFPLKSQRIFSLCGAGEQRAKIINTFNLKQAAVWSVPHWLLDWGPFESILVSWTFSGPEGAPAVVTQLPSTHLKTLFILARQSLPEQRSPWAHIHLHICLRPAQGYS